MHDKRSKIAPANHGAATPLEPVASSPTSGWLSVTLPGLAMLLGVSLRADSADDGITFPVRRLEPRETLCPAGDEFESLYVVRSGFLKTVSVDPVGNGQVLEFPMRGDVIGLGRLEARRYTADAIGLDTSHVALARH